MVLVVLVGPKVTFLVVLFAGLTCIALLVFKIDVGVLVDMVDGDDADDPLAVVSNPTGFKEKSEVGARL